MLHKQIVGPNFYQIMQDLGENYVLTDYYGDEFHGKMSIAVQKYSRILEEKEYLLQGAATFPGVEETESFRGCYFTRDTDPGNTYIMTSIVPEPTDSRIGYIYVTECNEEVTLANLIKTVDEKGDNVTIPVPFAENVKVYFDTTLQRQKKSSDGNFEGNIMYMQMPAKYGLSEDQVVLRDAFQWDDEQQKNVMKKRRYRVEAVSSSMTKKGPDGEIYGILDVQMSLDTRG